MGKFLKTLIAVLILYLVLISLGLVGISIFRNSAFTALGFLVILSYALVSWIAAKW